MGSSLSEHEKEDVLARIRLPTKYRILPSQMKSLSPHPGMQVVWVSLLIVCIWALSDPPKPSRPFQGEIVYDVVRHPYNWTKSRFSIGCEPLSYRIYVSEKLRVIRIDMIGEPPWFYEISYFHEKEHYTIDGSFCEIDGRLAANVWEMDFFGKAEYMGVVLQDEHFNEWWAMTTMPFFCDPPQTYYVDGFSRETPVRIDCTNDPGDTYFVFRNKRLLTDYTVFDKPIAITCTQH